MAAEWINTAEERELEARRKLEALLLEGLDGIERGEGINATPAYWQDRRRRLMAQIATDLEGSYPDVPFGDRTHTGPT